MKNFIIEKYYGTNTYLRNPLNLEDPNWFKDFDRFADFPFIPFPMIMSEKEHFGRVGIKRKVMIPCPEGWKKLEWRIAYEAVDQLCMTESFLDRYDDRGRLEISIIVNEIDENTWEAFCEGHPEDSVIISRNELPNYEEQSIQSELELKIYEYKNKTKDFLFDQRKALVNYYQNKDDTEALKELQRVKEDLETVISITGFSKELEEMYTKIDNILYEHGM